MPLSIIFLRHSREKPVRKARLRAQVFELTLQGSPGRFFLLFRDKSSIKNPERLSRTKRHLTSIEPVSSQVGFTSVVGLGEIRR